MKKYLLLALLIFITGCSSTPQKYDTTLKNEKGIPLHGNFCGPDVPNVKSTSKFDRIIKLKNIKAIDRIDEACKRHDICYNEKGFHNSDCDLELIKRIDSFPDNDLDTSCMALEAAIVRYFQLSNPSNSSVGQYIKNASAGTVAQASNSTLSTAQATQGVIISTYLTLMSPVLLVSGVSPSEIKDSVKAPFNSNEHDLYYPKRYTKCN